MTFDEKRMARGYLHAVVDVRHCGFWWCAQCHWRSLTGGHERRRKAAVARFDEMSPRVPKVRYVRTSDGRFRRP